jgi:hypothetical protein
VRRVLLIARVLVVPLALSAADDPCASALVKNLTGTWKQQVDNGKRVAGGAPKSFTQKYGPNGTGGIKSTADLVTDDGVAEQVEYSANFDGKGYPRNNDRPASGTIVLKCIDANTFESRTYRPGETEAGMVAKTVIAPDGKTMTGSAKGKNTRGQPVEATSDWVKQ